MQLNDYSNNYLYKSPFDISSEDIPENPFEDIFEQKFDNNAPKNEKNISSSNETDKKLSQKKQVINLIIILSAYPMTKI